MKIVCPQESLALALSTVGRAVPARSTLPVLGNILLATDSGPTGDSPTSDGQTATRLKVAATNLDLGITCWIDAKEVRAPGAITVPARLLSEFVGSLPNADVEASLDPRTNVVALTCAGYKANIKGIDAEEFPPTVVGTSGSTIEVNPKLLHEAIELVVFAAATEDSRPTLTGVLLSFNGSTLTLASADGFRLAVREIALAEPVEGRQDIIVPARALSELARIIASHREVAPARGAEAPVESASDESARQSPVTISMTENRTQVVFRLKDVEIFSRLIEGNFPNYQQIIPTSSNTTMTIDTKAFQSAIRVASFFSRETSNVVKLEIVPGGELDSAQVVVTAISADVGDSRTSLDATVVGEATQVAFNNKFLADVLAIVPSGQVKLGLNGPSRPGIVTAVGLEGYTYVMMPMHLNATQR